MFRRNNIFAVIVSLTLSVSSCTNMSQKLQPLAYPIAKHFTKYKAINIPRPIFEPSSSNLDYADIKTSRKSLFTSCKHCWFSKRKVNMVSFTCFCQERIFVGYTFKSSLGKKQVHESVTYANINSCINTKCVVCRILDYAFAQCSYGTETRHSFQ